MTRFLIVGVLASLLANTAACRGQSDATSNQPEKRNGVPEYFRANHGFGGGLQETVDLRTRKGFEAIQTLDDVARFAAEVPGAVGFSAHPNFEKGTRYARAILWYTKLSRTESSWALYLFDKTEAQKKPGDAPRAAATAAAEAKVSGKLNEARERIAAGGAKGVKLVGEYQESKFLAMAILRLGGSFEHTGEFTVGRCVGCRSVVPGGNPSSCGLGVQGKTHWNCCGSTNETGHCDYWKVIKAQDESRP